VYRYLFTISFLSCTGLTSGQQVFDLANPSFEWNSSGPGQTPRGWINIGSTTETPPDIQPGVFEVRTPARHGKYYLGMVTRDIGTWEGIAQKVEGWLKKDSAYTFSVWIAQSKQYISLSKKTQNEQNYDGPTVLNIIGFNTATKQEQVLGQSAVISSARWEKYFFTLYPTTANFDEIDLVAYYADENEKTNGHLLLDNCSEIRRIPNITFPKYGDRPPTTSKYREQKPSPTATTASPNSNVVLADTIPLRNSSFEKDRRGADKTPFEWLYMGTCKTCRPTIEPGVGSRKKPGEGKVFVALSVYEDGEVECIGQKLQAHLLKGEQYTFSVKLARDRNFSALSLSGNKMSFGATTVFRVLGYNSLTNEAETLAQTIPIDHDFWYRYDFTLTPKLGDYDTIALEVQFLSQSTRTYNGHVLVDDCSAIIRQ